MMENWSESQLLGIDKDHGWKASLPFQKNKKTTKKPVPKQTSEPSWPEVG